MYCTVQSHVFAELPFIGWGDLDGRETKQGRCVEHTIAAHDVILQREGE